ncbi:MAG: hypothetical protein ACW9XH_08005 [Candidatus Nitrosopumilus sp. bin_32a]
MTRETQLKNFLTYVVEDSLEKLNEINLKQPFKQKSEKCYEFKNDDNKFFKESIVKKNNFEEFFSRPEIKQEIEKINDFNDAVDIVSGYPNTKIFSKRGLSAEILVHSFIENYVKNADDFKFVDSIFKKTIKSFINFLDSEILQVPYFTPLFRLSFGSKNIEKELGEIKLVKINGDRFKIVKESLVGDNRGVSGELRKLSYVLEVSVDFKNNTKEEDEIANQKFDKFLKAAYLFDKGDLKIGPIYKNYSPWMNNASKILNIQDVVLGPNTLKLTSTSFNKLKVFYREFCNVDLEKKDWSFIQVAIDRFSSNIIRNDSIDKIVDLNVALECLFSSAGETSLKISNRCAMMVGLDENDQELCWNFIKNTYKLRNDILHGRKENNFDITNDVLELERIIRIAIRKFLNLSKNISKKELKSEGKIKKDDTLRDYVLNELDLGLINRTRLEPFSIQTSGPFN